MAKPRTIDGKFNQRYYSAPTSIHNQPGKSSRVPASKRFAANDSTRNARVQTSKRTKPTIDEEFNAAYAKKGIQPISLADRRSKKSKAQNKSKEARMTALAAATAMTKATDFIDDFDEFEDDFDNLPADKKRGKLRSGIALALRIRAQIRVTRISIMHISWVTWLWLWVQIPLASLSLIFLGIALWAEEILEFAVGGVFGYSNPLASANSVLFDAFAFVALAPIKLVTGVDINILDPKTLFMFTNIIILGFVMTQVFVVYLSYKLAWLRPLSGKAAGFKMGMLLLIIIGYSLPLLNLFPWIYLWMGAVWLKPK